MSVKTPVFLFDVPVLGEEANVPADLLSLATEIENVIKALEVKRLKTAGAGDAKKLLIVSNTGEPVWRAMSGDATISELGVIEIGGEKVSTPELAALCVTEAKVALEAIGTGTLKALAVTAAKLAAECVETGKIKNLAVTAAKIANETITEEKLATGAAGSRIMKPTSGRVGVASEAEINSEVDLEVGKLELTPAVQSKVLLIADLLLNVTEAGEFRLTWKVKETKHAYQKESLPVGSPRSMHRALWSFNLEAGVTTSIFLCVSRKGAAGKAKILNLEEFQSGYTYMMVAS